MTHIEAAEIIARLLYDENRKYAFTQDEIIALEWGIKEMRKIAKRNDSSKNNFGLWQEAYNKGHKDGLKLAEAMHKRRKQLTDIRQFTLGDRVPSGKGKKSLGG